jgi:hypothetical protein
MIEGKAENLDEWYQILQETFDKYNVLISNLQEPEDKESNEFLTYKKLLGKYVEAQAPSKYYLEQRN